MRLRISALLIIAVSARSATLTDQATAAPGSWPAIFSSIGLTPGKDGVAIASARRPNYSELRVGVWYAFTH